MQKLILRLSLLLNATFIGSVILFLAYIAGIVEGETSVAKKKAEQTYERLRATS